MWGLNPEVGLEAVFLPGVSKWQFPNHLGGVDVQVTHHFVHPRELTK